MPGCLLLIGTPGAESAGPPAAFTPSLLSPEYPLFALQGARGFPGTPGLPGVKGHRVSIRGKGDGRQELLGEETFWGTHIISPVGSQMRNRTPLLFPRVTQAWMVLREKLVLQV